MGSLKLLSKIIQIHLPVNVARKLFWKFSQSSQETTCAGVSFLTKGHAWLATSSKIRLWHNWFLVNFIKLFRAAFLQNIYEWLLLNFFLKLTACIYKSNWLTPRKKDVNWTYTKRSEQGHESTMWEIDIGWFSLLTGSRISLVLEDYYIKKFSGF